MSDLYFYIAAVFVLFVLVLLNNRRNQERIKKRRHRSFRDNYMEKKKERNIEQ